MRHTLSLREPIMKVSIKFFKRQFVNVINKPWTKIDGRKYVVSILGGLIF